MRGIQAQVLKVSRFAMAFVGTLSPNYSLLFSRTKRSLHLPSTRRGVVAVRAESMTTEKLGVKIESNPSEARLTQLGVRQWPKWGCPPSKFPWTYEDKEICYLLKGKVKVTPSGSKESVEIGAGDLVEFPKGMSCTWDVSVGVDKHYKFE